MAITTDSAPILPRRRRQMLFERPLKMRLIGETRLQCHVRNQLAAAQLILGELDAPVHQERVGCHAVMLFEGCLLYTSPSPRDS